MDHHNSAHHSNSISDHSLHTESASGEANTNNTDSRSTDSDPKHSPHITMPSIESQPVYTDSEEHQMNHNLSSQSSVGSTPDHSVHTSHSSKHGGVQHVGHDPGIFLKKLWWSVLLTLPVLAFSEHFLDLLGIMPPSFPGIQYIAPMFGSLLFFYGGMVFLKGGLEELKRKQPGMMTLIALAITVSYGYSLLVTLGVPGEEIYWELATLIVIMLLGHWLEMRAIQNAGSALQEMAKLLPDYAVKIEGDQFVEAPIKTLRSGDLLLVRPGSRVPVDGQVVQGESLVNQSMVTGESIPVAKRMYDSVIAGTINEDGSLRIRVTRTGDETYLAGIMRLVEEAQKSRSKSQILADRAAYWLVIIALVSALLTAVAWGLAGAPSAIVMERVVTVMVAACPHALGLAIPLVIAISTTLTAQAGLLVRNRLMFEVARNIDYVVFDKTGTLTRGEHKLTGVIPAKGLTEDQVLRLAAAAELDAEHMVARAIVAAARERNLDIPSVTGFGSMPGRGITAQIDGLHVQVGGPNLLSLLHASIPPELIAANNDAALLGNTSVYLIVDKEVKGILTLADAVKAESQEAIRTLKSMGIKVAMLTGDNESVAAQISEQLGIDEYFAGILPENKAAKIRELQQKGYRVAMVGDGINDAPSLAQADVGVAIGAGTDVAIESAGIVLVHSDPRDVARLFIISKVTYRKMMQNLAWATGYNVLVIPLAAGVLAPWGVVLPMTAGAVVMSLSTIIVVINAQLLRKIRSDLG